MGRVLVIARLAARDVRRRWVEALLLVLAVAVASCALTLGLLLHYVGTLPYQQTKAATHGADLVAQSASNMQNQTTAADVRALHALDHAPGVTARSGPFPATTANLRTPTVTAAADVIGRPTARAAFDQPAVTDGTWVRPGGVVVERAFADAAGLDVGDTLFLNGRRFAVVGLAVTSDYSPYPLVGCMSGCGPKGSPDIGLMWTTESAVHSLATAAAPLTWVSGLQVAHPSQATALENRIENGTSWETQPFLLSSQQIAYGDANLIRNEQAVLLVGAWLLTILAVASVAVLVGGRMADQMHRVGLLKAVGGTPSLVAVVLMSEYVLLALVGAAVGLLAGWLSAPALSAPGPGLLGATPAPPMSGEIIGLVAVVAVVVALLASLVPAVRAARSSTVRALADTARRPRRASALVQLSRRMPVPVLIGIRVMARRLRRTALAVASIFVTVSGIVAVLIAHTQLKGSHAAFVTGVADPSTQRADQVLGVITVMLVALACVNAVFITRAMAHDAVHASAITRALGATPQGVTLGLSLAQVLPALLGALLGIPGGILLFATARNKSNSFHLPPTLDLLAVVAGTVLVVAVLTAIPARLDARRPIAGILQAELA